jgi:tetratricopeptide (TPR) repeat protein
LRQGHPLCCPDLEGSRMKKRLNLWMLIRLGVVLVLLGTGVHFLHGFQRDRLARSFRQQGARAAEEKDLSRSALSLSRYLSLCPDDIEAQVKYGLILGSLATTSGSRWRAYHYLGGVLRRVPEQSDVRQSLGHLAVQLGNYQEAVEILLPLRNEPSLDRAEVEQTLAWCYLGAGDRAEAARCFENAIRLAPGRVDNYVHLAGLWQRLGEAKRADQLLAQLIATNTGSAEAYRARGRFFLALGRLDEAARELDQAAILAPGDAGLLLEAAELSRRLDRLDRARELFRRGLATRPPDVRLFLARARMEKDLGRISEALTVLRRGLKVFPQMPPELIALLAEMLLERGDRGECDLWVTRLRQAGPSRPEVPPLTDYLAACQMLESGQWVEATRSLEKLCGRLAEAPFWLARVETRLSRCYRACSDGARQVTAARRACELDPASRLPQLALARALTGTGNLTDACDVWERLMARPLSPADGWLEWGEALSRWNAGRGIKADWEKLDRVLSSALEHGADPVRVELLWVRAQRNRGQLTEARTSLEELTECHPDRTEVTIALAELEERQGNAVGARALLSKASAGDPSDETALRLARVHFLTRSAAPIDPKSLKPLLQGLDRLPRVDQGKLLAALTPLTRSRADQGQAEAMVRRWCAAVPYDLTAWTSLFDQGVQRGDDRTMKEAIAGLRHVEGEDGVRWRCGEVMQLLSVAGHDHTGKRKDLATARRLLAEARRLQPDWGRVAFLEGSVDEAEGNREKALKSYRKAFEQGDRHQILVERLVRDLSQCQRFAEVGRILSRYQQVEGGLAPVLSPALAQIGSEAALRQRDFTRAAELARLAVPAMSRDYRDSLWLAGILDAGGYADDARQVLEALIARQGDVGDIWVALIRHLAQSGQRPQAEEALARARKRLAGITEPGDSSLAQALEALGRADEAEKEYLRSLKASPANAILWHRLAQFYLDQDRPEDALPLLRSLASPASSLPGYTPWARRMMALVPFQMAVLGRLPEGARWPVSEKTALWLLDQNRQEGKESVVDRRARALVIGIDPKRRMEAIELFEKTRSSGPLTLDERFRLAQLYELAGNRLRAGELMLGVLNENDHNPQFIAGQVRRLLAHDDRARARPWLLRLEKLEPDSPRTRALKKEAGVGGP